MKTTTIIILVCLLCSGLTRAAGSHADFSRIDAYARAAPAGLTDYDSIARYLQRGCTGDMDRARAAYTWVAENISYDAESYNTGIRYEQWTDIVLKRRLAVCAGFAEVYGSLCRAMGLEVVRINGYSKGYSYKPGNLFEGKRSTHAWNAVKADGRWMLVDATWGSGYGHEENGKMVNKKRFSSYWFDTDPYAFLFEHFPADTQWTLVPLPLTVAHFEQMPHLREYMFEMGFDARDILTKIADHTLPKELPHPFYSRHHLRVVDMPLTGVLTAGTQMDLTIISEENLVLAISNDISGKPIIMHHSGDRYTASILLRPGDLHIAIGRRSGYSDILQYKVK